jgi:ATP synthase assembly factor FMC1, mitochondrial
MGVEPQSQVSTGVHASSTCSSRISTSRLLNLEETDWSFRSHQSPLFSSLYLPLFSQAADMAPNAARIRSIYRSLMRELPPRPILASPRSPLHTKLRSHLSSSSSPATSAKVQDAQVQQLVEYLRAQRKYVTLVERYNPGMNMDEEERVRLSARRVGMDMPIEYAKTKGQ